MRIIRLAAQQRVIAHFVFESTGVHGGKTQDVPFAFDSNTEVREKKAVQLLLKNQVYPFNQWKGRNGTKDGWVFRYPAFTYGML